MNIGANIRKYTLEHQKWEGIDIIDITDLSSFSFLGFKGDAYQRHIIELCDSHSEDFNPVVLVV